jgi:transcriptional regulator with XRE-family HTH domain
MDLLDHIAARIRDLRVSYNDGEGLSQDSLATLLKVAPNTISRFFGVSINSFFPSDTLDAEEDENLKALLRTARQLHPADVEELRKYAEFRRARNIYEGKTRPKPGRKGGPKK